MTKQRDRCTEFGRRLKKLRLERHLSQERLAELAAVDRTYIGAAEQGRRNPTLRTIGKLADALGVDDIDLLSGPAAAPDNHS